MLSVCEGWHHRFSHINCLFSTYVKLLRFRLPGLCGLKHYIFWLYRVETMLFCIEKQHFTVIKIMGCSFYMDVISNFINHVSHTVSHNVM